MAHPGGRPTTLTPELIEKAKGYLDTCIDVPLADGKTKVNLPSIAGLSIYLGTFREQVYEWQKQSDEFDYICSDILTAQEQRLLGSGLGGQYNSTITSLVLGKHNYHKKVDSDLTTGGEKMNLVVEFTKPNEDSTTR